LKIYVIPLSTPITLPPRVHLRPVDDLGENELGLDIGELGDFLQDLASLGVLESLEGEYVSLDLLLMRYNRFPIPFIS
jgi:hypothetical protein